MKAQIQSEGEIAAGDGAVTYSPEQVARVGEAIYWAVANTMGTILNDLECERAAHEAIQAFLEHPQLPLGIIDEIADGRVTEPTTA